MSADHDFQLAKDSLQLIGKDLRIDETLPVLSGEDPLNELKLYLTKVIQYLLDYDFSGLLNAMYRVDLAEEQVSKVLEHSEPKKIAENLAVAIIEREKAKVITRNTYSSGKP